MAGFQLTLYGRIWVTPKVGTASAAATTASQKFRPCEICEHIQKQSFHFLSQIQYELATNPKAQRDHAEHSGFCSLHTWQYESIASPQGTCSET
jgi:hypothetical protein